MTTTAATTPRARPRTAQSGPPLAVPAIAYGVLASVALTVEGLTTLASSQVASVADAGTVDALATLTFDAGSAAFVPPFALLVAGIAVPSVIVGLLPKAVSWFALAVAAIGLLGTFTVLTDALDVTLPIGRFGGLIAVLLASFLLPATRPRRSDGEPRS